MARYYTPDGSPRLAKPRWNGGKSSFDRKRDAQTAIDEALDALRGGSLTPMKIGAYSETWLTLRPRSKRTNKTNTGRLRAVLAVEIEGRPLGDWEFDEFRRRQTMQLVNHMLVQQGRAAAGARGILRVLSAMAEDAITDDAATENAFLGARIRANDPRVQKPARKPRIWTFDQMREFARGGRPEVRAKTLRPKDSRNRGRYRRNVDRFYSPHDYEALILTPGLTGLRLGEVLALMLAGYDGRNLTVKGSAHDGEIVDSSDEKNHDRVVPVGPCHAALLDRSPARQGTGLMFVTPTGKLWREQNFYRDVWAAAEIATGLDPTPHEFRHSYVSQLQGEDIDDADLARVAGHGVETMLSIYTHPLGRSHEKIRAIIG